MQLASRETDQAETTAEPAETAEAWDLIVRPQTPWSLRLDEIFLYRDLLYLFIRRDIVSFYKQTVLGPLWFFIQPILTSAMFVLVFGQIAGLSTAGAPQFAFYLCGIIFWNYFADCLNKTSTVFRDNAQLFGKVYFPRVIAPLAIVCANMCRLAIQFALLSVCVSYYWSTGALAPRAIGLAVVPLSVLVLATLSLGLGMLFSALTSKYRDMVFLLAFGVQLFMYATPVIYPMAEIPQRFATVLGWNPLAPLFEAIRYSMLGAGSITAAGLAYSAAVSVLVFAGSLAVFNRVERTFIDTV